MSTRGTEDAPFTAVTLARFLRGIATRFARTFPAWLLDIDDFVQIGLLGALSVRPQPHLSVADLRSITVAAAKREMIDAMRRFQRVPRHSPGRRQREVLVEDIVRLVERTQDLQPPDDAMARLLDLHTRTAQLSAHERMILRRRIEGHSYEAIGWELHRSQGWVYQHSHHARAILTEAT